MNFLDRLQDGLCENKVLVRKILGNDLAENMRKMSLEIGSQRPSVRNEENPQEMDGEECFDDEQVSEDQKIPKIAKEINTKLSLRNV